MYISLLLLSEAIKALYIVTTLNYDVQSYAHFFAIYIKID